MDITYYFHAGVPTLSGAGPSTAAYPSAHPVTIHISTAAADYTQVPLLGTLQHICSNKLKIVIFTSPEQPAVGLLSLPGSLLASVFFLFFLPCWLFVGQLLGDYDLVY